jgi:integrase
MTQDGVLKKHILPRLSKLNLKGVKPDHISDVLNESKSKGHAPNTTKKIYMILSKVFRDAVEFGHLKESPVKKRFHKPYVPPIKRPYIGWVQTLVVLEYVFDDGLYGVAVWVLLLTGIRISELEALEWPDIDFNRDEIKITKSYCVWAKEIRSYTKNKNQYAVPMPPMLRAFLWNRRKTKGFVCTRADGVSMFSRWAFRSFLHRLQEALHLVIRSSHALRHSCARIYVEKGARDEEIMELLGHKWLASSKTYTHRENTQHLKDIAKKIA